MTKNTNALKYLTSYKSKSIIFKNFIIILLVIILPMMLFFFSVYTNQISRSRRELDDVYQQQLSNISTGFDNIYLETRMYIYSLSNNPEILRFTESTKEAALSSNAEYETLIGPSYMSYTYIDSIYIYSEKNNYVLSGGQNSGIEHFKDKSWLSTYAYLTPNELTVIPRCVNGKYPYYLSFILAVYNDLGEKNGAVVVNLNIETLINVVFNMSENKNDIYIMNSYKKLLLSNDIERIFNEYNQYAYIYDRIENSKDQHSSYQSYSCNSTASGLEYVLITPSGKGINTAHTIWYAVLLLLTVLIVALITSIFLALRTFKPIQNIIEAAGKNFNSENHLGVDNEVSFIIQNINSVIQDKRLIEIEIEDRIALLNNAYAVALQSQINPHFLYNTLETINFMSYKHFKAQNDISDMIVSLSKMLRIGLESETKIVPLSVEKEHLSLYVNIMTKRYPGKCDFIYDIPEEFDDCMVVKLILQPLVENAFQHGIRPSGKTGKISVSAHAEENKLVFQVSDNGVGMDKETLNSVREILSSDIYISSKHIGINNVNRRIKLLLGNDYGISVDSIPGEGTTFTITHPFTKNNRKDHS